MEEAIYIYMCVCIRMEKRETKKRKEEEEKKKTENINKKKKIKKNEQGKDDGKVRKREPVAVTCSLLRGVSHRWPLRSRNVH